jgi:DNA-binding transcriptional LysR family regulator
MDIRDFRLLIALSEHRHFARAAEACHISQPAFSARLRGLEHALGVRIVERGARFERFTSEGERVLDWGRRIVALADGMQQDISAAQGALEGQLRLAAIPSQLPVAGELAAMMKERHSGVEVIISSRTSKAIDLALDHYECDLGLTYLDAERPAAQRHWPLYEERYVAIVPHDVARFPEGPLAWRDAAGLPLALLNGEMQNRRIIDDAFRQAGAEARAAIESDTFAALLGAVRLGRVATILPASHAALFGAPENAARHDLTGPELTKSIGLVSPRRDPELPLIAAFAALAVERFGA